MKNTAAMSRAFSLVALTLVLDLQLCSSAPIPAKDVQVCGPRGTEEPAPVTEDHSNLMEEKEPDDEKLLTAPAEGNMLSFTKVTEQILSEYHVSDDADELASQEPSAGAPQESSEDEPVSEDFAESSPGEAVNNAVPAVAVESERHHVADTAPESPVPIIPEDNATEETAVSVENASPEDQDPAASIPVIPVGPSEVEAPEEPLLIFPDDTTEEETAALPIMPEEEDYIVPVPAELEREEAGQWQTAAEESASIVPADPAEEDLNQEEAVVIVVDQNGDIVERAAEQMASQAPAPEDLVDFAPQGPTEVEQELREQVIEEPIPVVSPGATEEDAARGPVQTVPGENPATMVEEEKSQVEPAAGRTSPVPEEPSVIETTGQIPIVGPEGPRDDASEDDSTGTALDPTVGVQGAATDILTGSPTEAVEATPIRAASGAEIGPASPAGGEGIEH